MPPTAQVLQITLPRGPSCPPLSDLLAVGRRLLAHAARRGGHGRCYCSPKAVGTELAGLRPDEVDAVIDRLDIVPLKGWDAYNIVVREIAGPVAPPGAPIVPGQYLRAKLRWALLCSLPPGAILVSHMRDGDGQPQFCALVRPSQDPEILWTSAKSLGVADRLVDVLWDLDDVGELIEPMDFEEAEVDEGF